MTTTLSTPTIARFLEQGAFDTLAVMLAQSHPADTVTALRDLSPTQAARAILCLERARQAELFGYFDPETQVALAGALERGELARVFGAMAHDERADLFARLSEPQRAALLPGLAQAERDDLRRLAAHPEGSVGAVMTSDYATVAPELTTVEAVEHLRRAAPDAETIYHSYVVDADNKLVGTVSLRELIVSRDDARVSQIMRRNPPRLAVTDRQDSAVEVIRKYDLLAVPVCDDAGRLVGIVTYDDAMDVAQQTETERFARTSAVRGLGVGMLQASALLLYRKRIPWLVVLVFGNLFSGAGIAYFEDTIAAHIALVFFLPLLIDSGGNAGSQSATLMVREVTVAAMIGLTMAAAVSMIGVFRGGPEIAMVVALTMVLIVLVGSVIGMALPFVLSRFRVDPAVASAPLVTTVADATGVIIYFAVATWLLGLPAAG